MRHNVFSRVFRHILAPTVVFLLLGGGWAQTVNVIYSFAGGVDGDYPDTDLVADLSGNIYGTTVLGGTYGSGTVFMLSPDGNGGWTHTVLYNFTSGADGGQPYQGVTCAYPECEFSVTTLYGAAASGGSGSACEGGCGVVYQLSNNGGVWTETVLHNFTGGKDGSRPRNSVVAGLANNLYGMTPTGGTYGFGTIYQVRGSDFRVLHEFTGGADGASGPTDRLFYTYDKAHLLGVTTAGGAYGAGTAFELNSVSGAKGQWTFNTLYSFAGTPDAGFPYSAIIFDQNKNIYATTYSGGANNLGSVYQLHGTELGYLERVLYSFNSGIDGKSPLGNLVLAFDQALYGTTSAGGTANAGTVFKLTPNGDGTWSESFAYSFQGAPDASLPYNGMVGAKLGIVNTTYYGATISGGANNHGAIYEFVP